MIPAKYFSKNNFLFQYFKTVNFGPFLRITQLTVPVDTGTRPYFDRKTSKTTRRLSFFSLPAPSSVTLTLSLSLFF